MLRLGVDPDAQLRRQLDDLLEGGHLVPPVVERVARPQLGDALRRSQRLDLGQREVLGEPAGQLAAVDRLRRAPVGELGTAGDVRRARDLVLVAGDEHAVLGRDSVLLDVVGAHPGGQRVAGQRVLRAVAGRAAMRDHHGRHGGGTIVDHLVQPVLMTGSTSVSGRVYEHLRAAILAGEYESLPSERRLSDELGASRHAVREALKRLQQSGLIRISHGGATRVRDWRRHGGLELLLELDEVPAGLEIERPIMEMRASVGADAARRCATRASAVVRAELEARAEMLAAEDDLDVRNTIYEAFWDLVIDGADNLAYRLALNTLHARPAVRLHGARVAAELRDPDAIRALAGAIAGRRADDAHELARELLERSA
jgi:DNA-binding FadR family transcriptional regulator